MHPPNDWLEIVNVERPRIEHPIPANDVERVVIEDELLQSVELLDDDGKVAEFVEGLELAWHANVALEYGAPSTIWP